MITVTRLNGQAITINAEIIELVEETPDTIITTMTGKKLIVRDTIESIIDKIVCYRRRCFENVRVTRFEEEA